MRRFSKYNRDLDQDLYSAWRRKVIKRDKKNCQMPNCPGVCKRLQVHHIRRWKDAPAIRYDINNGITLCKDCHKKITGSEEFYQHLFSSLIAKTPKIETELEEKINQIKYGKKEDS